MKRSIAVTLVSLVACTLGCSSRGTEIAAPDPEIPPASQHRTAAADRTRTEVTEQDLYSGAASSETEQVAGSAQQPNVADSSQPEDVTGITCPMTLNGVSVSTTSTANGVALEFSAPAAQLQELRGRVEWLSNVYNGPGGLATDTESPRSQAMDLEYTATSQTTAGGARILFTPNNPSDLELLRAEIQRQASIMRGTNTCPTLSDVNSVE